MFSGAYQRHFEWGGGVPLKSFQQKAINERNTFVNEIIRSVIQYNILQVQTMYKFKIY